MSTWILDDADDIINLDHMEAVMIAPIGEEEEGPEGHTHQLLATNAGQEAYRIFSGTEEACKASRESLARNLEARDLKVYRI